MASRLFISFIALPLMSGYFAYSYHYDQYESLCYHVPMMLYSFFWYFGE